VIGAFYATPVDFDQLTQPAWLLKTSFQMFRQCSWFVTKLPPWFFFQQARAIKLPTGVAGFGFWADDEQTGPYAIH
jgi:hypothetical protein